MARTLVQIGADIDAANDQLKQLLAERSAALVERRSAIIQAFDEGATRQQICDALGVEYAFVARVLNKAGRNERQRQAQGLGPDQQADYARLVRQGVRSRIARVIAQAVAP